ncbi:MAG: putative NAD/FAD-dependent oxidoreductase, partial [Arcticibacterium sp.]
MENNIDSKVSVVKTAATQARDKKLTSVKATQARKLKAKEVVAAIPLEQKKEMVTKIKPSAVKEISNEIKAVVTSKAKDISKKADFSKNVDEIKTSVKTLNDQIIASTSSIFEDVIEMNKEIANITVKSVEVMASNFDMDKEVEKIRSSAVELNEKVVNRSKELNS